MISDSIELIIFDVANFKIIINSKYAHNFKSIMSSTLKILKVEP